MITNVKTPGVYIDEVNAFPNSVVEVPTAVPAFIGYTPQAMYEGKSYTNKPLQINSMAEFNAIFAFPADPNTGVLPPQQTPHYYLTKLKQKPKKGESFFLGSDQYAIEPDPGTIYYLYNSVKMYFDNGGGTAYIVSVGGYGPPTGSPIKPGDPLVNPNVTHSDLKGGLDQLTKFPDVTMYIYPEATLLSPDDNSTLTKETLLQCGNMQTAVAIFDIIGGHEPDPILWQQNDITPFRNGTGTENLKYGVAYYPFLKTTVNSIDQVTYLNVNNGDPSTLNDVLNPPAAPNAVAVKILGSMGSNGLTTQQNHSALLNVSKIYKHLITIVQEKMNIMPPSGIMAGIYAQVDNSEGVWVAPANISPVGAVDITLHIDSDEQGDLNVDALTGKSINAIRYFNGQGVLVWGARTLDGNSQDWRYINVRRTVTMIEQSIKLALRDYVFSPNTDDTWVSIKSMLENFLTNTWKEGALAGAKAEDAFAVQIGLGQTMTPQDILDGFLRVSVLLAVSHPAEFIVVTVQQELQKS